MASWAARFLFTGEQLNQPVRNLSGGERARVLIAKLMLEPADVLLLDEPTNDLDIPTLEILEENLLDFPGALVLVTHDRYLLNRVASTVLGLDGRGNTGPLCRLCAVGRLARRAGRICRARRKRGRRADGSSSAQRTGAEPASGSSSKEEALLPRSPRVRRHRAQVEQSDARLAAARDHVEHPEIATDATALQQALKNWTPRSTRTTPSTARWAELTEKAG